MFSAPTRCMTFPRACLSLTLAAIGMLGMLLQFGCGGKSHAAPAVISSFKSSPSVITAGQGALLSFTFTGTGTIDHGVGAVTSGQQITVTPAADTTYTLTALNAEGNAVGATATISVKTFTGKFVYVGNSEGGIAGFALNDATGALTELNNSPFAVVDDALHVTSDPAGKFLFVVNGDGAADVLNTLTVYSIHATTGDLTKVAAYPTGTNPWTAAVDPSGQYVYVRCDGSLSAYKLNSTTGALTPLVPASIPTSTGMGAVVIHPSGQYLFTVGRTSSQLQVFNLNVTTGALTPNGAPYSMPAGTGPRGLALDNTGEFLFTKSEGLPGAPTAACFVYGYRLNVSTGALTALAAVDTGLESSDSYHGIFANPIRPVLYVPMYNSTLDYTAFALNPVSGALTPIVGTTYDLFGATGSDGFTVSRNGKWGLLTDYNGAQIAIGAIDPTTGALTNPTFYGVGNFPVTVTVVGTVQ